MDADNAQLEKRKENFAAEFYPLTYSLVFKRTVYGTSVPVPLFVNNVGPISISLPVSSFDSFFFV